MTLKRYRVKVGKHHERNKVYKTGDILIKDDEDMPAGFLDKFEDLGAAGKSTHRISTHEDDTKREKEKIPGESLFKIEHRGGGRYRVINTVTNQPVNDQLLSKADAEALIAGYE